jgi:hypothetical protein
MLLLVLLWAVFAGFGSWVARQKNRSPVEGATLGFLFGPIGVIVEAVLPQGQDKPKTRRDDLDDAEPAPDFSAFGQAQPKPPKQVWEIPKVRQEPEIKPLPDTFDDLLL